jgi:hypothetical protein
MRSLQLEAAFPQCREEVKGSHWLMERDCKHGTVVKMDKSGKVSRAVSTCMMTALCITATDAARRMCVSN